MRINKYLSQNYAISRRNADHAIANQEVYINGELAKLGDGVQPDDDIEWRAKKQLPTQQRFVLAFHKPVGVVCSRKGQGSKTIYQLLPSKFRHLDPVGRLDKNSSGLLLLTNDGDLIFNLTHPSQQILRSYQVKLDKALHANDIAKLQNGVDIGDDKPSRLKLSGSGHSWTVNLSEGRNRQIRRSFEALGYRVIKLHRISHGTYHLAGLKSAQYRLELA